MQVNLKTDFAKMNTDIKSKWISPNDNVHITDIYYSERPDKYRPVRYKDNLLFVEYVPERILREWLLMINSELTCQNDATNEFADFTEMVSVPEEITANRYRRLYKLAAFWDPKKNIVSDRVSFNSRLN